jgi:hypothetical protein
MLQPFLLSFAFFFANSRLAVQHNSAISRAVSFGGPGGPYKAVGAVVESPFAHNPTIHQAPDGTYVIYHIGDGQTHSRPP